MLLNMNFASTVEAYSVDNGNVQTAVNSSSPTTTFVELTSLADDATRGIVLSEADASVSATTGVIKFIVALKDGGVYMVDEDYNVVTSNNSVFGLVQEGASILGWVVHLEGLKFGTADADFTDTKEYKWCLIKQ